MENLTTRPEDDENDGDDDGIGGSGVAGRRPSPTQPPGHPGGAPSLTESEEVSLDPAFEVVELLDGLGRPAHESPHAGTPSLTTSLQVGRRNISTTREQLMDWMRAFLGAAVVALVGFVVVGGFIAWRHGDDLDHWAAFITPVYTLAGVAVTFYFTRDENRNR